MGHIFDVADAVAISHKIKMVSWPCARPQYPNRSYSTRRNMADEVFQFTEWTVNRHRVNLSAIVRWEAHKTLKWRRVARVEDSVKETNNGH